MYNDYKIFLDCDGVILDSEELVMTLRKERSELSWDDFFETLDWEKLYRQSTEINESLTVIRALQEIRNNVFIISKVHSLKEARCKIDLLRDEYIKVPIFIVPPHVEKNDVCIPDSKSLLIDDGIKNLKRWEKAGGCGLLFDPLVETDSKEKVKSLHFLLNR